MIKITITGSGSACGVPFTGCNFGVVDVSNPKNIRTRSAAFFETDEGNFFVECGPDFRMQTYLNKIKVIDNIFLSHGHADHIIGVWELAKYAAMRDKPVNLFGSAQTLGEVKNRFAFMYAEGKKVRAVLNEIKPFVLFKFPETNVELLPLPFIHQNMNPLGFKYKNMVYTPDFYTFPDTVSEYLQNLDLWIMELTSRNDIGRGHNYLDQLFKLLDKYQPKECVLNHLSDDIDYDEVSKLLPSNVRLAYDGMVITVT